MEDNKLKQWIKVLSPVLVYMLLHTIFKAIFGNIFNDVDLDLLGDIELSIFVSSLSAVCMFPIVLIWYCLINKPVHIKKLESFPKYIKLLVEIIIMSLTIAIAVAFVMDISYGDLRDNSNVSVFEIIASAFLAPICEELIYRDVVFRRCSNYFGKVFAIIFSGILFGIAHSGSAVQIVVAICVGMIFNLIYLHYRSVIVTILVHIGVNLLSYSRLLTELPSPIMILGFISLIVVIVILLYHFNDDKGRIKFKGE